MDTDSRWDWAPEELGSLFQHQMQLSVEAGLRELSPLLPSELEQLLEEDEKLPPRFGDMFFSGAIDRRILRWTRSLALRTLRKKGRPLPREVVELVVCLTEAASSALRPPVKTGSRMANPMQQKVLKLPWLSTPYRTLLLKHLRPSPPLSPKPNSRRLRS